MRTCAKFGQASRGGRELGQAMVEFMLVTIFLFLLFVCILQMILLMHAYNTLADAAKEGVRYAIVHGTQNSICSGPGDNTVSPAITCTDASGQNVVDTVTNFASVSFQSISNTPNVEVSVSWNPPDANGTCANGLNGSCATTGCSAPGCMVKVTVSHVYTPLFGLSWPSFALNAAANGRIMN
jgi:Flp pilus assembly protein TadG